MTHEQFEEAIEINKRIEQLKRVLKEFEEDNSCRLSLINGGNYCSCSKYDPKCIVREDVTDLVKDKLEIYTKNFIKELKEEIDTLNKKIEKI